MIKKTKKIKNSAKVNKDILMGELISRHPETAEILAKYGFHCVGCMISPYESLEAGAAVHGIALKPLLTEINKKIKK